MQGEELCFDYGDPSGLGGSSQSSQDVPENQEEERTPCVCRAQRCKKYLPYVANLF
jgi:hypothetical protein